MDGDTGVTMAVLYSTQRRRKGGRGRLPPGVRAGRALEPSLGGEGFPGEQEVEEGRPPFIPQDGCSLRSGAVAILEPTPPVPPCLLRRLIHSRLPRRVLLNE